MSLTGTLLAFAYGIAARIPKPRDYPNADVEITRLREELAAARMQVEVMRIALMEERRPATVVHQPQPPYREIVDCTGGGRYGYLRAMDQATAQAQYQQAMQAQQMASNAMNAQQAMQNALVYGNGFQQFGHVAGGLLQGLNDDG